jgi:hypothetical protein
VSRGAWRYQALAENTLLVKQFCKKYGFTLEPLNSGYQLRIEQVLDIYPVRQKYHYLPSGKRGDWDSINDIKRILLDSLPDQSQISIKVSEPRGHIGQLEGVTAINGPRLHQRLWRRIKGKK